MLNSVERIIEAFDRQPAPWFTDPTVKAEVRSLWKQYHRELAVGSEQADDTYNKIGELTSIAPWTVQR